MRAWAAMIVLLTTLTTGRAALAGPPESNERVSRGQGGKTAQIEATVELVVAHGKNDGKGIDPRLAKHKELQSPPFSSYNSYALLEETTRPLAQNKPVALQLPDGGELRVVLDDFEGKGERPGRFVLKAIVKKPGGDESTVQVKAKPGAIFFVAGQKHDKGILVLGIKVR
ncbi:MAG: hypothetical protein FJ095_00825 [Deltaproteobacteria bacterium]|nr:hypothetical protein [Deltaproteobacteria bacterium]